MSTSTAAAPAAPLRRRAAAAVAVAALALSTALVSAGPARADAVSTAQARLDALQPVATKATAELLRGTKQWEADQARLRRLQLDQRNAARRVGAAQAELAAQQDRVDSIGRSLYMRPVAGQVQLAFTRRPEQVLEALQSQAGLAVTAGSQVQVVAKAARTRSRLTEQQRSAEQLVEEATRLADASATRLRALRALATRTAAQLEDAQQALSTALAERDAARAKAARERAARASRTRVSSGPSCTGRSTAGQANGNLDPGSLCPLWMAPGHRLRADAARAFNAMSQHHAATVGTPLCVTDSYRSYSEQVSVYNRKPGLAAVPGTSNHGWGVAVDFCGGVQSFGSSAYQWMKANAGRFGFVHPDWAEPSGSKPEPWHWEFNG